MENYYVPSTLHTNLCPPAILQTDNITFILQGEEMETYITQMVSGRLRIPLLSVPTPKCRLLTVTHGNG